MFSWFKNASSEVAINGAAADMQTVSIYFERHPEELRNVCFMSWQLVSNTLEKDFGLELAVNAKHPKHPMNNHTAGYHIIANSFRKHAKAFPKTSGEYHAALLATSAFSIFGAEPHLDKRQKLWQILEMVWSEAGTYSL